MSQTRLVVLPPARAVLLLALCVLPLAFSASLTAADIWRPRPDFAPCFEVATGAEVRAIAVTSDGKFYVGGEFSLYDAGGARANLVRFNADGSLDTSFSAAATPDGRVNAMVVQPDGRLLVAGEFGLIAGTSRRYIARLNTDGSLDATFVPGAGFGNVVNALALQDDGRILVGGRFSSYAGIPREGIARLNADASLDATFTSPFPLSSYAFAFAFLPGGKILVGGSLPGAGGLVRLNSDGSRDTSFNIGAGFNGSVGSLLGQPDGRILVGGGFTSFVGFDRRGIARLLADGQLDTTFAPPMTPGSNGINFASGFMALPGGQVLVWGQVPSSSSNFTGHVVRLNVDGSLDPAFGSATIFSNGIYELARLNDGRLLVGGPFTSAGGATRLALARLSADGALDANLAPNLRRTASPALIQPAPGGKWMVGGTFDYINGVPRKYVVRLNSDGTLDPAFDPGTTFTLLRLTQADGKVIVARSGALRLLNTGAVDPTFSMITRPGDGSFLSTANGGFVASQYSGMTTLSTYLNVFRFGGDGVRDATFPGSEFVFSNTSAGSVSALAFAADGKIVVGGGFTAIGTSTRGNIARLLADGGLDTTFDPGTGFNSGVSAVAVQPDNKVVVGGGFTAFTAGVNPGTYYRIARLTAGGVPDPTFSNVVAFNERVTALALDTTGKIWATGGFTHHENTLRPRVARLNSDGTLDNSFSVPSLTFTTGTVSLNSLSLISDNAVAVGGGWMVAGGRAFGGMAILERVTSPAIMRQPASASVEAGGNVTLATEGLSTGAVTYQWRRNGVAIAGATAASYTLPSAQLFDAGNYTVVVSDASGSTTSSIATLTVSASPPSSSRVLNLSTRGLARTGDDVLITGFVVQGTGTKRLLIRGVGPGLAGFGVGGVLANPQLTLKRYVGSAYQDFAANDNWSANTNAAEIVTTCTALSAFPLSSGSADSVLLVDLPTGTYSAVISGVGATSGVAIAELYDADASASSATARLVNLSTRGFVGISGDILIPGLVVSSEGAKTLLVRAAGPALAAFGVSGALADPKLVVFANDGTALFTNDNWEGSPTAVQTAQIAAQVNAFPLQSGSKDAALVVTLQPGVYTVQVSGVGGTTGIALAEVYVVP